MLVDVSRDDDEAERRLGHLRERRDALDRDLTQVRDRIDEEVVAACCDDGLKVASIARAAGLSRQAVYDILHNVGPRPKRDPIGPTAKDD